MRPIKFRGRDINTGKFVSAEINDEYLTFITDDVHLVDADSIAQLVGYDCDGREVYEGDFLVNDNGDGFFAELVGAVITDEGFLHADIPPEVLKLKEAQS